MARLAVVLVHITLTTLLTVYSDAIAGAFNADASAAEGIESVQEHAQDGAAQPQPERVHHSVSPSDRDAAGAAVALPVAQGAEAMEARGCAQQSQQNQALAMSAGTR